MSPESGESPMLFTSRCNACGERLPQFIWPGQPIRSLCGRHIYERELAGRRGIR